MNRLLAVLGGLIALALTILLIIIVLGQQQAYAHSWYSQRRDPVFNAQTCCRNDCGPVPSQYIHYDPLSGDIRVTLPLEVAKKIYHGRSTPFDEIIPHERIQYSEDGQVHICLQTTSDNAMQGFWCFFVPPES